MSYELKGTGILDKVFEAENVGVDTEVHRDYIIPVGEKWYILSMGGSASVNSEVEFLFSPDGGSTWLNPFDGNNDILRCIHITSYSISQIKLENALMFEGDGENTILRISCKNGNGETAEEIVGWINGFIDY